ncbi:hypothetical protein MKEN_01004900 [Mycena kentingensis (nom. inval.)]|nr:hypothetical protein MKEN_01004900 [Mycena kentingensis (nom. inval.)]
MKEIPVPDSKLHFPNSDPGYEEEALILDTLLRIGERARKHVAVAASKSHATPVTQFLQDVVQHLPYDFGGLDHSRRIILANLQTNASPTAQPSRETVPLRIRSGSRPKKTERDNSNNEEDSPQMVTTSAHSSYEPTSPRPSHLHIAHRTAVSAEADESSPIPTPQFTNATVTPSPTPSNASFASPPAMYPGNFKPHEDFWAAQATSPSPTRPHQRTPFNTTPSSPTIPVSLPRTTVCPRQPTRSLTFPSPPHQIPATSSPLPPSSSPTRGTKRARGDESDSDSGDDAEGVEEERDGSVSLCGPAIVAATTTPTPTGRQRKRANTQAHAFSSPTRAGSSSYAESPPPREAVPSTDIFDEEDEENDHVEDDGGDEDLAGIAERNYRWVEAIRSANRASAMRGLTAWPVEGESSSTVSRRRTPRRHETVTRTAHPQASGRRRPTGR